MRAISNNARKAEAWQQRGMARIFLGEYDAAIQDLNQALELKKQDPWPYYYRGLALFRLEDYATAIPDFEEAIKYIPEQPEFSLGLAWSQLNIKQVAEAQETLKKALFKNPEHPGLLVARASSFIHQSRDEAACGDVYKAATVSKDAALLEAMNQFCGQPNFNDVLRVELLQILSDYAQRSSEAMSKQ